MLLGALGLLATAAALLGIPWLLAVTLIALTTEFMVRQLAQSLSAASAIVYGVGLLVLCETVIAATTLPRGAMVERTVAAHRLLGVSYAVVVAAAASAVALLGGSIRVGEAVVAASIGIAAAVGLLTATGLSS